MGKKWIILLVTVVLLGEFSLAAAAAAATPAAKIVSGVVTNVVSTVFKWLWSMKTTSKTGTAIHSRSMVKFEGGYTVETVFDGTKAGIEPYSLEVSPAGEILVLDSENSNIYRIPTPLSRYSRPKLVAGSAEGYTGHVDGRPREARMNHPKGLAMDDKGNIYVADTLNMAIRKISDSGVVTIAGGKVGRGGGHVDGPSEDAKLSDDFDVVYIGSSCSLLVIDRGDRAIREIQLHEDDCSYQNDDNLPLGIAVLVAAVLFGYVLALLQRKIAAKFSRDNNPKAYAKGMPPAPYQRPSSKSGRHPLLPQEDEYEKQDEGLFGSMGRLFLNAGSTIVEIFGGLFSSFRRKPFDHHMQPHYHRPPKHVSWPVQESYMIPHEDEPPPLETRDHTPRKSYPYMTKDLEKTRQFKQSQSFYRGYIDDFQQQHHQEQQLYHQHHQKQRASSPQTHYEKHKCETNEIVFGAIQEQDGRREAMVIKAVDFSDPMYNNQNVRSRYNYMGYSSYGY
ncbi:Six-bladed beta-propeller [Olea europaea subsp. europaea]|uniref:Six-bladed beta-propeller n=2 Tax=Olea europaea subsp. europaea TaxID=158383 RepID=A0A8S0PUB0_OLEEU|nr:Six-bladed beta-propeller [Olea europaea subsp. europaea]